MCNRIAVSAWQQLDNIAILQVGKEGLVPIIKLRKFTGWEGGQAETSWS